MHRLRQYLKRRYQRVEQIGINMVDLMMWLVIAALLLSAAIQGIGYYQQGAYTYQAKEEADTVASRIVAAASMDSGRITYALMEEVVNEHNAEHAGDEIEVQVGSFNFYASGGFAGTFGMERASSTTSVPQAPAPGEDSFLRINHAGMKDTEVVYFFKDTGGYKNGSHLIKKGSLGTVAPSDGSTGDGSTGDGSDSGTTPVAEPVMTEAPADSNAPSATVVAAGSLEAQFANRTVKATAKDTVRFSFAIQGSADVNNYKVEWFPFSSATKDAVVTPGTAADGSMSWYGDVSTANGYAGEVKVTAKVTNLTTKEVSYKTWIITVTDLAIVQPYGPSDVTYVWNDKSVPSHTSGMQRFGFSINDTTASDFEVTWTGGENVNATLTPNMRIDGWGTAWQVDTTSPNGYVAGSGKITANAKHKASGYTVSRTWTLTVTPIAMAQPYGPSDVTYVWNNKSVPARTSGMQRFGFSIPNSNKDEYEVTWTGGENVNATLTPNMRIDGWGTIWQVDATSPSGFLEGAGKITATMKHKPTGHTITKTWDLTVTPFAAAQPYGPSDVTYVWNNKSVPARTSGMQRFGFSLPNSNKDEYEVTWTGGENVNATLTPNMRIDGWGTVWQVDANSPNGFLEGAGKITATMKHLPSGTTTTKTWDLTVTPFAVAQPYGPSEVTYVWHDKTAAVGSTNVVRYGFSLPNSNKDQYEVTWEGSSGLNSALTPNMRIDGWGTVWQVDVQPNSGLTAGVHTVTATMKHIPSGATTTKTWKLTVQ